MPSSKGVSAGPIITAFLMTEEIMSKLHSPRENRSESTYQVITLSATGEAETPAGGSVCIRYRLSIPLAR